MDRSNGGVVDRRRGLVAVGWIVIVAAACSSSGSQAPSPSATPSSAPSPVASSSPSASPTNPLAALQRPIEDLGDRLRATIDVGGAPEAPDWSVVGYGAVWVANHTRNIVQRIDPKSNHVVASVDVSQPCSGMAAGFGSIWAPSCLGNVVRIDARSNRVAVRIPVPVSGDGEGQIAAGFGGVWLSAGDGQLTRIDPGTNRVVARIAVPAGSTAAVTGFGSVWLTSSADNAVTRIDPVHNRVQATIAVGPHPLFIAAGSGAVWVLNQGDGTVSRVDPKTGSVSSIDAQSGGEGGCVAAGLGAAWITIPGAPLTRIDASSREVTEQFTGRGGDCLTVGYGSVWLSNHEFGNVYRIAPP